MTFLFAAYTIVWLGLLAYAFNVSRQNRRLAEQIEALEAALAAASPASHGAGEQGGA